MSTDESRSLTERRFLSSIRAVAVFFGAILAATVLVPLGVDLFSSVGVAAESTAGQVATTLVQYLAFTLAVVVLVVGANDYGLLSASVPDRRETAMALGSVLVLFALLYGLLTALSAFGIQPVQNRAIDGANYAPAYFLVMVVVSVLVVGPVEELLFRGAIQGLLKRAWGAWPAILGASVLFGLVHYGVGAGTFAERFAYVAVALLLGIVLGYLYEYTGNLVVPALAHGGYNAVSFGIQYLDAVGYFG